MMQYFFGEGETMVEKVENAVDQHFLLFSQSFQKGALPSH